MLPRFPLTALAERVVGGEGGCRRILSPSLGTGLWVVLLFLCLSRGALILLYVEDHLLLFESMMCMDNVLVEELTLC